MSKILIIEDEAAIRRVLSKIISEEKLDSNALISGYPATQQGQLDYLNALKAKILEAGGEGLIYWEPDWV